MPILIQNSAWALIERDMAVAASRRSSCSSSEILTIPIGSTLYGLLPNCIRTVYFLLHPFRLPPFNVEFLDRYQKGKTPREYTGNCEKEYSLHIRTNFVGYPACRPGPPDRQEAFGGPVASARSSGSWFAPCRAHISAARSGSRSGPGTLGFG